MRDVRGQRCDGKRCEVGLLLLLLVSSLLSATLIVSSAFVIPAVERRDYSWSTRSGSRLAGRRDRENYVLERRSPKVESWSNSRRRRNPKTGKFDLPPEDDKGEGGLFIVPLPKVLPKIAGKVATVAIRVGKVAGTTAGNAAVKAANKVMESAQKRRGKKRRRKKEKPQKVSPLDERANFMLTDGEDVVLRKKRSAMPPLLGSQTAPASLESVPPTPEEPTTSFVPPTTGFKSGVVPLGKANQKTPAKLKAEREERFAKLKTGVYDSLDRLSDSVAEVTKKKNKKKVPPDEKTSGDSDKEGIINEVPPSIAILDDSSAPSDTTTTILSSTSIITPKASPLERAVQMQAEAASSARLRSRNPITRFQAQRERQAVLRQIRRREQDLVRATKWNAFKGRVYAVVDFVTVGIPRGANETAEGIKAAAQATSDAATSTVDTIASLPSVVQNTTRDAVEAVNEVGRVAQEVQQLPSELWRQYQETLQAAATAWETFQEAFTMLKVNLGLEKPVPKPPKTPPPVIFENVEPWEVAEAAGQVFGRLGAEIVILTGQATLGLAGALLRFAFRVTWDTVSRPVLDVVDTKKEEASQRLQARLDQVFSGMPSMFPKTKETTTTRTPPPPAAVAPPPAAVAPPPTKELSSQGVTEVLPGTVTETTTKTTAPTSEEVPSLGDDLDKDIAEALRLAEEALAGAEEATRSAPASIAKLPKKERLPQTGAVRPDAEEEEEKDDDDDKDKDDDTQSGGSLGSSSSTATMATAVPRRASVIARASPVDADAELSSSSSSPRKKRRFGFNGGALKSAVNRAKSAAQRARQAAADVAQVRRRFRKAPRSERD